MVYKFFPQPGLPEGVLTVFKRNAYSSSGPGVPQNMFWVPPNPKSGSPNTKVIGEVGGGEEHAERAKRAELWRSYN